ncbi:hypothetical protein FPQ18DRAFT_155392 [Pyronema domesticum]|nr:hypothetical protein FPQ18DRAFT_155392 [Pyronema domesticum]
MAWMVNRTPNAPLITRPMSSPDSQRFEASVKSWRSSMVEDSFYLRNRQREWRRSRGKVASCFLCGSYRIRTPPGFNARCSQLQPSYALRLIASFLFVVLHLFPILWLPSVKRSLTDVLCGFLQALSRLVIRHHSIQLLRRRLLGGFSEVENCHDSLPVGGGGP